MNTTDNLVSKILIGCPLKVETFNHRYAVSQFQGKKRSTVANNLFSLSESYLQEKNILSIEKTQLSKKADRTPIRLVA